MKSEIIITITDSHRLLKLKKIIGHKNSRTRLKMYVLKLSDTPELSIPLFTIKNDAMPMRIYKIVHTMPKIYAGGANGGLVRVL